MCLPAFASPGNASAQPLVFIDDATVSQRPDGSAQAVFPLGLTRPASETIQVDFRTVDGTATAPSDYVPATGSRTFSPGATRDTIAVEIPGPLPPVGAETFFVELTGASNAALGDERGQATISAITPRTLEPVARGYLVDARRCIPLPFQCFDEFTAHPYGDLRIFHEEQGISHTTEVGVAEFEVASVPRGLETAVLNLTYVQFDSGAFTIGYVPAAGDGELTLDDYGPCRLEALPLATISAGPADQRRVDVGPALEWATTNRAAYLTFCFQASGRYDPRHVLAPPTLHLAPSDDLDLDGVDNALDNCLREPNPDQSDADGDGDGDACDLDDDDDGLSDEFELAQGLDPRDPDMDDDGLSDLEEVCYDLDCESYRPHPGGRDTDATKPDTDGGGKGDFLEARDGTDALDRWDDILICSAPVQLTRQEIVQPPLSMSADGTKIAYEGCDNAVGGVCHGNRLIYVVEFREGSWQSPTQVSHTARFNSGASLSADGTRLAYRGADSGSAGIFVADHVAGAWQAPVAVGGGSGAPTQAGWPFLSADGERIFYSACDGSNTTGRCEGGDYEIFLLEQRGSGWSEPQRVTDNAVADYLPATTADGSQLAFLGCSGGSGDLCTGGAWQVHYSEDDGLRWQEPAPVGGDPVVRNFFYRPAISADGSRIAYTATDGIHFEERFWRVRLVERRGGAWEPPLDLGGSDLADGGSGGSNRPVLSADGTKLAAASGLLDTGLPYFEQREGEWLGPARNIPAGYAPAMSADGARLAYRSRFDGQLYFVQCVSAAVDSDGDGVFDDGDWSGGALDHPCNGQRPAYCDDNCAGTPNADQADADADGHGDVCDNCRETSNPDQADLDWPADDDSSRPGVQHYGDACDADLDNDGVVGATDFFGVFRPCLGQPPVGSCRRADLDGDGTIGATDFFGVLRPALGGAPGPGVTDPS